MPQIDRVETRAKLKPRRDPYWQRLTQGRFIGYRRMARGSEGNWLARFHTGERYEHKPLGDLAELPEKDRFDAAKRAADAWFTHLDHGGSTAGGTVKSACEAYVQKLALDSSAAAARDARLRFSRLIDEDRIGSIELTKLTARNVADWKKRVLDGGASRASFNRNATALRAALNLALKRRDVASNHAWIDELRKFENADRRRELYLTRSERLALLNAASAEAQRFIKSCLLVPFRPGDVAKLKVEHFDARQGILHVQQGKTAPRDIPLSAEAVAHFKACARGKLPSAWLVSRGKGAQWSAWQWGDAIHAARDAASLPAATCAYSLRHAVITDLVTGGLDIFTVAKLAGTSVTMIEKNYGHLQREHARAALETLSLGLRVT